MPRRGGVGDLDANGDGEISDQEAAGDALGGLGITLPPLPDESQDDALWGYEGQVPGGLTVPDQSGVAKVLGGNLQTGARYHQSDTTAPARWSPEQRAQMQRALFNIGLYGKGTKVTLGTWNANDQKALTLLLTGANQQGRTWFEQLAYWKTVPPKDLLDQINGASGAGPKSTIQITNPTDIRNVAMDTSRNLTGRVDRQFVDKSVGGYQQQEVAAQQGTNNDQAAGGGGTVTQAPSLGGYLDDQLRRDKPLEVDGYSFLNAFDTLQQMIGGG